jgi:hypothetical protein
MLLWFPEVGYIQNEKVMTYVLSLKYFWRYVLNAMSRQATTQKMNFQCLMISVTVILVLVVWLNYDLVTFSDYGRSVLLH